MGKGLIYRLQLERRKLLRLLLIIFSVFPVDRQKIMVCSYYGKGYGDNGKAIIEELRKRNRQSFQVVWLIQKREQKKEFPPYIKPVTLCSFSYFFHLATAGIWIDNCRKKNYVRKRKKQFYIQTWHGSPMLKRVEKDAGEKLPKDYIDSAVNDSSMIDLFLSNSAFSTELYRRAFWYDGKILECGSPRMDALIRNSPAERVRICKEMHVSEKSRFLLYAPTFRQDHSLKNCRLDYRRVKAQLEEAFGGTWVILVRLHPNITEKEMAELNLEKADWLRNVTGWPDMYELMQIADVEITDYSSTMFEAAMAGKPVFLYMPDMEMFKEERGLYFSLEELPFLKAESEEELILGISGTDFEKYRKEQERFLKCLGVKEQGTASRAAAEIIERVAGRKSNDHWIHKRSF